MSFARDVKLEVTCTGPVPGTLETLHCRIGKSRGNPDSKRLGTFFGQVRLYSNMRDALRHTETELNSIQFNFIGSKNP